MRIGRPRLKVLPGIQLGRMFSMPGPLDSLRPKGGFGVGSSVRVQVPATLAQSAGFGIGSTGKAISAVSIAESAGFGIGGNSTAQAFSGLLDQYPGAAAAYSIRLLLSTYTGPLVTIRKSGDNAEKDFYPDANFELSLTSTDGAGTDLLTWIGADNGFIKTWYDQSGNSNNATITTTSQQHQIVNAGALITSNLKPAGNGENKQGYAMSTPVTAQTSLSVVRKNVSEPYNYAFGSVSPSITGLYIGRSSTNLIGVFSTLATNSDSSVVTGLNTQYLIYANKASGTTWDVSKNGDADDSITDSGTLYCNYIFGRNLDFLTLSGLGQEIILYNTDKSANKAGIINNINTFYSIY